MKQFYIPLALALLAMPLVAQQPALTLEQRTSLRCAAAFAIIADGQMRGNEVAQAYPPVERRGKEFFVRISARLMDETGMTREQIAALLQAEARALRDDGSLDQVMPACLLLLDAAGL